MFRTLMLTCATLLALAPAAEALTMRDLPPELRRQRQAMLDGKEISYNAMRQLADRGDGLAAFRYARRLEESGDPKLLPGAAHYYARAAYSGRAYAVGPLVRILKNESVTLSPAQLQSARDALTRQAAKGEGKAAEAMAWLLSSGDRVEPDPPKAQDYLEVAAGAGNTGVLIEAAVALLEDPEERAAGYPEATRYLKLAAAAGDLSDRATALNMQRLIDSRLKADAAKKPKVEPAALVPRTEEAPDAADAPAAEDEDAAALVPEASPPVTEPAPAVTPDVPAPEVEAAAPAPAPVPEAPQPVVTASVSDLPAPPEAAADPVVSLALPDMPGTEAAPDQMAAASPDLLPPLADQPIAPRAQSALRPRPRPETLPEAQPVMPSPMPKPRPVPQVPVSVGGSETVPVLAETDPPGVAKPTVTAPVQEESLADAIARIERLRPPPRPEDEARVRDEAWTGAIDASPKPRPRPARATQDTLIRAIQAELRGD